MKLQDKILYCRKKAGLTQEELAEKIGVSRQAVSKWETGDALPEVNKLRLLAQALGVTADWLLSEEEPPSDENKIKKEGVFVNSLAAFAGALARRYGWLAGAYTALAGLGFTGIGALVRAVVKKMFSGSMLTGIGVLTGGGAVRYDGEGNAVFNSALPLVKNNPVYIMGSAVLVCGLVLTAAGIALAVYLKKKNK